MEQIAFPTPKASSLNHFYITFRNNSSRAMNNVVLLPCLYGQPTEGILDIYGVGSERLTASGVIATGLVMESSLTVGEINKKFINETLHVMGLNISTNNVANLDSNIVVNDYRRKMFGGVTQPSTYSLSNARVAIGNNGYSNQIPEYPFDQLKDWNTEFILPKIEPNSFIKIEFLCDGIGDGLPMRKIS
jgi:hypothetical protein